MRFINFNGYLITNTFINFNYIISSIYLSIFFTAVGIKNL